MIVVRLMGGLGNQLFQYAAGRALALKHNTGLQFDLSFINADTKQQYTKRELELTLFGLNIKEVSPSDLTKFKSTSFLQRVKRKLIGNALSNHFVADQSEFKFLPEFNSYPRNTYLNGYWQSEKYFSDFREYLLNEFVIKKPKSKEVLDAEKEILNSNSVSLHIRRGDYVSLKSASEYHGVLSLEYYYKAIETIKKQHPSITVFVFSDDMEWVKQNLKLSDKCVYVDFNKSENSVFDMYLMSCCKHNIIANSSFSWWGAWLNTNKDKIVIAPKAWFTKKDLTINDLIPDTWLQM